MPPIVTRLDLLSNMRGVLDVDIIGHSLSSEDSPESLAVDRAIYLWERLSEQLMVFYSKNSLKELGDYLTKRGISVEIREEVHSADAGAPSIVPWATGPMLDLPQEHLLAWVPFAIIKWEFNYGN